MPKQEPMVFITTEGRKFLDDPIIKLFLHNGAYFVCEHLHQDAAFLAMENVQPTPPAEMNFQLDLQIPYAAVQYIVSGGRKQVLGFATHKQAVNKKTGSRS